MLYRFFNLKNFFPLICVCLSLLNSACEHNKFRAAESLYSQRRYAAAIEQLDEYIRSGKNGANVTRAELIRSASYYELGLAAIERKNWNLATRLLKLSNSEKADDELAKVYLIIAKDAIESNDNNRAKQFLSDIIQETSKSPLVPEVLHIRIKMFLETFGDRSTAWSDYMILYNSFPNDPYEISSRTYISSFIMNYVNDAVLMAYNKKYYEALEDLFQIRRYPVGNQDRIDFEIANIYIELAEIEIMEQDYFEANRLFLRALQFYPAKQDFINKRLQDIAYLYIDKGNDLLQAREYETALIYYRKTFDIIPDFALAKQAITKLQTVEANVKKAEELFLEAQKLENTRYFIDARKLYLQAYQLDNLAIYSERASVMGNLIEAEKDPVAFTRTIVEDYKSGLLYRRIQAQKQLLLKKFKLDEIRDSGWRILRSPGQYKYEARYDLLSPSENLYYVWQVNLKDKTITPLNKISERIMQ